MKRKQVILTAVLLSCVAAVLVPNWREIRFFIAYDHREFDGMRFHVKHADWLAGNEVVVPSQTCASCLAREHPRCFSQPSEEVVVFKQHGGKTQSVTNVGE